MKKRKKIFIPSKKRAFVAGQARRKHPRFVLTWWESADEKIIVSAVSRQVLDEGAFYEKNQNKFLFLRWCSAFLFRKEGENQQAILSLLSEGGVRRGFGPPSGR
jgi:hypothetical protein